MRVIIDNGSYSTRAGFITDQKPRFSIPTSIERKSCKQDLICYKYPIQNGKIIDWDIMENLWHRIIFELLQVQSSESQLTMTCNLFASKNEKEKLTQIMFETFEVPQLTLQFSSVSSLISTGRTSGLVLDCGYEETFFVPVFEGYRLQNQTMHLSVGGKTCSEYLLTKILQKYPNFNYINKISIIEHIKENLCYTNTDEIISQNYELPDGTIISLNTELTAVPEVLFQPQLIQVNQSGIQNQYQICINKNEAQAQIFLFSHTVLAGGNSRYKGFYERFIKEIKPLFSENQNKILQMTHAEYFSSWIGCSIAQQTKIYNQITRVEYDEYGPSIVQRKLF